MCTSPHNTCCIWILTFVNNNNKESNIQRMENQFGLFEIPKHFPRYDMFGFRFDTVHAKFFLINYKLCNAVGVHCD